MMNNLNETTQKILKKQSEEVQKYFPLVIEKVNKEWKDKDNNPEYFLLQTHLHVYELDFKGLYETSEFNLWHDVFGICSHLNLENYELERCFMPRFGIKMKKSVIAQSDFLCKFKALQEVEFNGIYELILYKYFLIDAMKHIGRIFHPDTEGKDYFVKADRSSLFNDAEAKYYDSIISECFECFANHEDESIYDFCEQIKEELFD